MAAQPHSNLGPLFFLQKKCHFFCCRKVRKTEGLALSRQYSTLFGEVSAADGRNVEAALMELAKLLREREDLDMQKALKLSLEKTGKPNKSCCSKK